eukprot:TRINITY_DN3572_c0_g1_i2.p2 TRINITY_DN3572_c0_g1~~TRINITY_DN3572_c0_g1_i2.p2  ORF type:complete len:362 (+),score=59.07 TRINITY_DN3572_c0_g1_i2:213-1298(+)
MLSRHVHRLVARDKSLPIVDSGNIVERLRARLRSSACALRPASTHNDEQNTAAEDQSRNDRWSHDCPWESRVMFIFIMAVAREAFRLAVSTVLMVAVAVLVFRARALFVAMFILIMVAVIMLGARAAVLLTSMYVLLIVAVVLLGARAAVLLTSMYVLLIVAVVMLGARAAVRFTAMLFLLIVAMVVLGARAAVPFTAMPVMFMVAVVVLGARPAVLFTAMPVLLMVAVVLVAGATALIVAMVFVIMVMVMMVMTSMVTLKAPSSFLKRTRRMRSCTQRSIHAEACKTVIRPLRMEAMILRMEAATHSVKCTVQDSSPASSLVHAKECVAPVVMLIMGMTVPIVVMVTVLMPHEAASPVMK